MVPRFINLLSFFLLLVSAQAFVPVAFSPRTSIEKSITSLDACRVNAKKEKRKRNRENMRKFSTGGKGASRRKIMKKAQAANERVKENEFIAKCFITDLNAPEGEGEGDN